ncbi:MAG: glycerophosphodiester phosphodiesterase [Tenericutes bacterium]|nr:glycerophosphodiester phosphodiesterase [Mycoplasmatota bacterium]
MKDLSWIKNDLIAHRGLHHKDQSIPENSLLAFQNALEHGYTIEFDVNVLKDGTVVSFHDFNFKRLCNDSRLLSDVTYPEIKDLKLLNTKQHIPKLKEVLDLVNNQVPLLIELKPYGNVLFLCQSFMETMKDYQGDYAVFSFHPKVVKWFKKNHPDVIRGQISEYFKDYKDMSPLSKRLMKKMFFNRFTKPDFVSYGIYDMPNKYLDKLKEKGIPIISYAARSQAQYDFVKSHYDNAVFEFFIPKKNEQP